MTETDFAGIRALGSRAAGYAVAQKCLEEQDAAERADPSLRGERRRVLHENARSWYLGALGEMHVGLLLRSLGPEWFVRHAVPIGAGTKDVDHFVIGPTGVYAINTKHHSGASVWVGDYAMRVNNEPKHYLKDVARDAADAGRRLAAKAGFAVEAVPVIAIVGASSFRESRRAGVDRAAVMPARELARWLTRQPIRLQEAELGLLRMAAEEPATWHVDSRAADTFRVMQRFERLCEEVDPGYLAKMASGAMRAPQPWRLGPTPLPEHGRPAKAPRAARQPLRRSSSSRRQSRRASQFGYALFLIGVGGLLYLTRDAWGPALLDWYTSVITSAVTP